jgi:hypothetical protein
MKDYVKPFYRKKNMTKYILCMYENRAMKLIEIVLKGGVGKE